MKKGGDIMYSNNQGGCNCGCGSNNHTCMKNRPFLAVDNGCQVLPANTGSIIPFSSGTVPAVLVTTALGLVGTASQIGFGSSVPGLSILNNTINLNGLLSEAFVVPRTGNITAISASFTATVAVPALTGVGTITAQIYKAPAGSTVFTATNATVNLAPNLTGLIAVGQTSYASANVAPIPVAVGDRLLMVFSLTGSGITVIETATGNASAGITIS